MNRFFAVLLTLALLLPLPALAVDQADLMKKIDELSRELDKLKQQMQEMQKKEEVREEKISTVEKKTDAEIAKALSVKGWPSWLELGGDYRFRHDTLRGDVHDYLQYNPFARLPVPVAPGATALFFISPTEGYTPRNESLMTNRFRLDISAKALEDAERMGGRAGLQLLRDLHGALREEGPPLLRRAERCPVVRHVRAGGLMSPRGGKRPGAGRKPVPGGFTKRLTLTPTREGWEKVEAAGGGNLAGGIRRIIMSTDIRVSVREDARRVRGGGAGTAFVVRSPHLENGEVVITEEIRLVSGDVYGFGSAESYEPLDS